MRQQIQHNLIDPLQFQIDVFPGLRYQPLPWIGYPEANRGSGTSQRWDVMKPIVEQSNSRTALDIGCNVGFFCFAMAEMGLATVGVEGLAKEFRIAAYARRKLRAAHVGLLSLHVAPATVGLLPACDTVLLLSVWHHWVRSYGLTAATSMLRDVWQRTGKLLFFETGESEMPAEYGLPAMTPSPLLWLTGYLSETCAGGTVRSLGQMKAFAPGGSETLAVASRNLFVVAR